MRRALPLLILVLSACNEGASPPTTADCEQVAAHTIELQVAAAGRADAAELDKHRRILTEQLGAKVAADCRSAPAAYAACALAAEDAAALERCRM